MSAPHPLNQAVIAQALHDLHNGQLRRCKAMGFGEEELDALKRPELVSMLVNATVSWCSVSVNREVLKRLLSRVHAVEREIATVDLEEVVGGLLRDAGQTLSLAESCTGGYLSHLITSVPGSSAYYIGGVVSYANAVKMEELGIPAGMLELNGAVSRPVVEQMASGVRQGLRTDWSIALSVIAGPDGGTPEKPVGTVWIAVAGPDGVRSTMVLFPGSRDLVIKRSAIAALNMLRKRLPRSEP